MSKCRIQRALLVLGSTLLLAGCATINPPPATGPRAPQYPVLLAKDNLREEATVVALRRLSQRLGNLQAADAKLQPITGTIASLPPTTSPLYLPKVGVDPVMNEEETRESLRRFIKEWQELIGADPAKLSLVERVDNPDGTKLAIYEQRPFRYPIRGQYGKLQIRFTGDRRILDISSTCIPDAERLQTALAGANPKLKAEDAIRVLRENEIAYRDASGTEQRFRVPAGTELKPRELVTYILPPKINADVLEFYVAWEIELTNAPIKFAYVDAVNGGVIAAH